MKSSPSITARLRAIKAFSLPEVAIAVAIAALAIITIMGLLPAGLDSIRHSSQLTAEARIMRQVIGTLEMSDWGQPTGNSWTQLSALLQNRYYFDDEANPITNLSQGGINLSYVVEVLQAGSAGSTSSSTSAHPTLPGASAPSSNSIILQINIAQSTNATYDFTAPNAVFGTHPAILTKQFYTTTP